MERSTSIRGDARLRPGTAAVARMDVMAAAREDARRVHELLEAVRAWKRARDEWYAIRFHPQDRERRERILRRYEDAGEKLATAIEELDR